MGKTTLQRSAQIMPDKTRQELADKELESRNYCYAIYPNNYLTKRHCLLFKPLSQVGATSAKDMGKVMGIATKQLSEK